MKNLVKFTVLNDGSIKVKISDSLYKEEFERVSQIYDLPEDSISTFKRDAMMMILSSCVQAWIDQFDCEAKKDYWLDLNGEEFHVIDGKCVYDDDYEEFIEESEDGVGPVDNENQNNFEV